MNFLATNLVARHVAETAARIAGNNPLVRTGAGAIAARWALRSVPAAVALVAAGTAIRYYLDSKRRLEQEAQPALDGQGDSRGVIPAMPAQITA